MSTNKCLIIRLQESCVNDELPYYNMAEVTIDETFNETAGGDRFTLMYESYNKEVFVKDGRAKISIDGGVPTNSVILTGTKAIKVEAPTENEKPYTICFPLEGLRTISARYLSTGKVLYAKFDIDSLKSVLLQVETRIFSGSHVTGSLNNLHFALDGASRVNTFVMRGTLNVEGDISTVRFNGIEFVLYGCPKIAGDVATFDAPRLQNFIITATAITGDLQAWANNMWNNGNGRTSGVCQITTNDTVTWGTTPCSSGKVYKITFSSNAPTITEVNN